MVEVNREVDSFQDKRLASSARAWADHTFDALRIFDSLLHGGLKYNQIMQERQDDIQKIANLAGAFGRRFVMSQMTSRNGAARSDLHLTKNIMAEMHAQMTARFLPQDMRKQDAMALASVMPTVIPFPVRHLTSKALIRIMGAPRQAA